ncbi:MAG TPA: OmpA family protein [bacterium]|nr:OmpA family protein [bacterium]
MIPLSKRCALDIGFRYTRLIDQSLNNIDPRGDDANTGIGEIRFGLLIRFGKSKEAKVIRKEVAEVPVVAAVPEEPPEPVKPVKEEEPVVEKEPVIEEEPAEAAPEPDILLSVDQRIILPAVQFATARAELSPEAKDALKTVAAALKNKPEINLEIRGYTDSIGSAASNLTLSQRRADTVKKFLVDQGISFHRLTAVGYGEADPIASNQTAKGRARNRRIELWPIQ